MQRAAHGSISMQGGSVLKGIGLMCAAIALFSCLDATAKYMASVAQLPVAQVTWLRFVSQFVLIVLAVGVVALPGCSGRGS
jgi:hypothetical protein